MTQIGVVPTFFVFFSLSCYDTWPVSMTNKKKTPLESVASRGVFLYHNDWRTYSKLIDVTADENNVILQVFFLDEK